MTSQNIARVYAQSAFSVFTVGAAKAGSDAVQESEVAGFEGVLEKQLDLLVLEKFLASL